MSVSVSLKMRRLHAVTSVSLKMPGASHGPSALLCCLPPRFLTAPCPTGPPSFRPSGCGGRVASELAGDSCPEPSSSDLIMNKSQGALATPSTPARGASERGPSTLPQPRLNPTNADTGYFPEHVCPCVPLDPRLCGAQKGTGMEEALPLAAAAARGGWWWTTGPLVLADQRCPQVPHRLVLQPHGPAGQRLECPVAFPALLLGLLEALGLWRRLGWGGGRPRGPGVAQLVGSSRSFSAGYPRRPC